MTRHVEPGQQASRGRGSVATTTARAVSTPSVGGHGRGRHGVRGDAEPDVEAGRELLGDRLHPARGDRRRAAHERAQQQVGEAPRRRHRVVEEHAGEERLEHLAGHVAERRVRRPDLLVGLGLATPGIAGRDAHGVRREPRLVETRPGSVPHRRPQRRRGAPRVGDEVPAAARGEQHAGGERAQLQRGQVEDALRLGVGRVEQLEPAVDRDAVDPLAAHATADAVARLEDDDLAPGRDEVAGRGQPGEPGPDHEDVGAGHALIVSKPGPRRTRGLWTAAARRAVRSPTLGR